MFRPKSWFSRNKKPMAIITAIFLVAVIAVVGFGNMIKNFFNKTATDNLKPNSGIEDFIPDTENEENENNNDLEVSEELKPGYTLNEDGSITYIDDKLDLYTIPASMAEDFLASLESENESLEENTNNNENEEENIDMSEDETVINEESTEEIVDRDTLIAQYVEDVLSGKAGNGEDRKIYLGEYYSEVMAIINAKMATAPSLNPSSSQGSSSPSNTPKPTTNPAPHYQMPEFYHQFTSVGNEVMINGVSHRYVKMEATTGLVNCITEEVVVPANIYSSVSEPIISRGVNFVWVRNTTQRGLFNLDTREEAFMVDANAKLDIVYHFEKAFYLVTLNGKKGLIDFTNPGAPREIFAPIYDEIEFIEANSYRVWKNGQPEDIGFFVPSFTGMNHTADFETQFAVLNALKSELLAMETPQITEDNARTMI